MAAELLKLTDANFDAEVLASGTPVLVDFSAEWCPPCRMLEPTIAALAGEFQGRVRVGQINVDENPKTTLTYNISALPTVVVFRAGQVVDRFAGVTKKEKLVNSLNTHMG